MNVFVYGTLMLPEVWEHIVHQTYKQDTATLHHFERCKIENEVYPAIIPNDSMSVDGIVYFGIDAIDVHLLDLFEGEEYQRTAVHVQLQSGEIISAVTYLYKSRFWHKLLRQAWNFDEFVKTGKDTFVNNYKGWKNLMHA